MDIQAILHSRKMSFLLKKMQKGVDVSSFTVPISRCSIVNEIINISQARKNLSQEQYNSVYALYKIYDNEKTEIPMTPYEYIILYGKMIDEFQQLAPWQMYNGDGRPYVSPELLQRIQKNFSRTVQFKNKIFTIFRMRVQINRHITRRFVPFSINSQNVLYDIKET